MVRRALPPGLKSRNLGPALGPQVGVQQKHTAAATRGTRHISFLSLHNYSIFGRCLPCLSWQHYILVFVRQLHFATTPLKHYSPLNFMMIASLRVSQMRSGLLVLAEYNCDRVIASSFYFRSDRETSVVGFNFFASMGQVGSEISSMVEETYRKVETKLPTSRKRRSTRCRFSKPNNEMLWKGATTRRVLSIPKINAKLQTPNIYKRTTTAISCQASLSTHHHCTS
jgi:hypothetical protein